MRLHVTINSSNLRLDGRSFLDGLRVLDIVKLGGERRSTKKIIVIRIESRDVVSFRRLRFVYNEITKLLVFLTKLIPLIRSFLSFDVVSVPFLVRCELCIVCFARRSLPLVLAKIYPHRLDNVRRNTFAAGFPGIKLS